METKNLHFIIAFISYPIVLLHMFIYDYSSELFKSGITFFTVAAIVYVSFAYLYFNSDLGKRIVLWGLFIIGIGAIYFAIYTA